MSRYTATIGWTDSGPDFLRSQYSREHRWQFDGGATVMASASPQIVPEPWSRKEHVDPEEAFVAALASCHMLFFLSIAARRGYSVTSYEDAAEGFMEKNDQGRLAMTRVILHPRAKFSDSNPPGRDAIEKIHHDAHELCFIANSVTTDIRISLDD